MKRLRSAISHIFASLFTLSLSLMVTGIFFSLTIGSQSTVEGWLDEGGFYTNLSEYVVQEAITIDGPNSSNKIVKEALAETLSPSFYSQYGEEVISGTYTWLNKESKSLNISLDVGAVQEEFIINATNRVEVVAASLPICNTVDEAILASNDPLNATCRPTGVTSSQIAVRAGETLRAEGGLFDKEVYSARDFTDADGQPLVDKLAYAPQVFYILSLLSVAGALGAIVCAMLLVVFKGKQSGARTIAARLISTAFFGAISTAGTYWFLVKNELNFEEASSVMTPLFKVIGPELVQIGAIINGALLLFGIVLYVLSGRFSKKED